MDVADEQFIIGHASKNDYQQAMLTASPFFLTCCLILRLIEADDEKGRIVLSGRANAEAIQFGQKTCSDFAHTLRHLELCQMVCHPLLAEDFTRSVYGIRHTVAKDR